MSLSPSEMADIINETHEALDSVHVPVLDRSLMARIPALIEQRDTARADTERLAAAHAALDDVSAPAAEGDIAGRVRALAEDLKAARAHAESLQKHIDSEAAIIAAYLEGTGYAGGMAEAIVSLCGTLKRDLNRAIEERTLAIDTLRRACGFATGATIGEAAALSAAELWRRMDLIAEANRLNLRLAADLEKTQIERDEARTERDDVNNGLDTLQGVVATLRGLFDDPEMTLIETPVAAAKRIHALSADRDRANAFLSSAVAERDALGSQGDMMEKTISEIAKALGVDTDNEAILEAIEKLQRTPPVESSAEATIKRLWGIIADHMPDIDPTTCEHTIEAALGSMVWHYRVQITIKDERLKRARAMLHAAIDREIDGD